MPRINYTPGRQFTRQNMLVIDRANDILEEYQAQGFTLTLRQLYYQFVARDYLANTDKNYKRLGDIINDARMAGLVDWLYLEDRTRNLRLLEQFASAEDALDQLAGYYHIDMWARQKVRPEVWVEKDALVGVVQRICNELDVPYFSCRGYTSQSEMWRAGQRLAGWHEQGYSTYIIHLGDHDPSGIDMSRDIFDRLEIFMGGTTFERIALNMDQIRKYTPPPNPAKVTDSRAKGYIERYGDESWELDALEPKVLMDMIRATVESMRDPDIYHEDLVRRHTTTEQLRKLAADWDGVSMWLDGEDPTMARLLGAMRDIERAAKPAKRSARDTGVVSTSDRNKATLEQIQNMAWRAIQDADC